MKVSNEVQRLIGQLKNAEGKGSDMQPEVWVRLYHRISEDRYAQSINALSRREFELAQKYMDIHQAAEHLMNYHKQSIIKENR